MVGVHIFHCHAWLLEGKGNLPFSTAKAMVSLIFLMHQSIECSRKAFCNISLEERERAVTRSFISIVKELEWVTTTSMSILDIIRYCKIIFAGATLSKLHVIWVWCFSAARQMTKDGTSEAIWVSKPLWMYSPGIRIRHGSCDCHADQRDHSFQRTGWKQKRIQQPGFAEDGFDFRIDWSTLWCN